MSTRPDAEPSDDEVVVGRLGKPHGIHGELSVELRTDEPDRRFAAGATLLVRHPSDAFRSNARDPRSARRRDDPRPPAPAYPRLTVVATRWHQDRLLVRFEEIADRTAAESARGLVLTTVVAVDEAPEDPEEFYDHQLVGLAVVTDDGTQVGAVAEVLHSGAQDLLVVRRPGREDALVPFVTALVPEIDLAAGRLLVADRPGLLEPLEED